MARPRSDDKRKAILAAAAEVIAEQGMGAPTARIAKLAGVAEGSLFTYFASKDELLNQLYLELKTELKQLMLSDFPRTRSIKTRMQHVWHSYVRWGVAAPHKRKALAQLAVSDRITEPTRAAVARAMGELGDILGEAVAAGVLRDQPPEFVGAIMGSLAETTIEFMAREPRQAEQYRDTGFEAFWRVIARK